MFDLVGKPKDLFCHVTAHLRFKDIQDPVKQGTKYEPSLEKTNNVLSDQV